MNDRAESHLRYNFIVNMLDGGFFGAALGFASITTVIPLFVSTMTNSAALIGLIPALHTMGWQLPQLFTARRISSMPRFKPYVMFATIHERLPFLGLAVVAWLLPHMHVQAALAITLLLMLWQGLGAGFAANAWQNMIAKVIPNDTLATFFGLQSAAANLLSSGAAVIAGILLERYAGVRGFIYCFLIGSVFLVISFGFLGMTREPDKAIRPVEENRPSLLRSTVDILKANANFRNFLVVRMLSQFGLMAFVFYIVYAVQYHGMSEGTAGVMTSILFITQVISNPLLGRLADRWSRKGVIEIGSFAIFISATAAWLAPSLGWFVLVFVAAGVANTAFWAITMAFTMDFGSEDERPTYVGMANTLISPAAILAPLLGGWLADTAGYKATFILAAAAGLATTVLLHGFVREPRTALRMEEREDLETG